MTTPDVPAERGRDELREKLRHLTRDSGPLGSAVCALLNAAEAELPVMVMPDESSAILDLLVPQEAPPILSRKHANEIAYFLRRPDMAHDAKRERLASLVERAGAPQEAPAEGISLSAQLSQAAAWMRVWDECQRLGMDTYGAPSTRTGLDIVLDFIRGHAAPQETREPELLGYVVERQRTPGEWVRVWTGRTLWLDHAEAVLERDAYALDGIPARIRPVYLGAPAPAEATEARDAMDFCPTCKHPRRTAACQCAPASGEPSGAEAVVREAWRSVTDSLPQPGAHVFAGYRDAAGRWRSVRAVYAAARWYEIADNADDVSAWRIGGTVTHWMPLPTAPGAPEEGAGT